MNPAQPADGSAPAPRPEDRSRGEHDALLESCETLRRVGRVLDDLEEAGLGALGGGNPGGDVGRALTLLAELDVAVRVDDEEEAGRIRDRLRRALLVLAWGAPEPARAAAPPAA